MKGSGNLDVVTAIKEIINEFLKNVKLADVVFGTYTGGQMKIDNRPIPIPMDMVILPQSMKDRKVKAVVDGTEREITVKETIKPNDRFVLMQQMGGQKYTIIGRL